jgi:hypothetical protein
MYAHIIFLISFIKLNYFWQIIVKLGTKQQNLFHCET